MENAFSQFGPVIAGFAALVLGVVAGLRVARIRATSRQRVVEPPNSHYTSGLVRERETRDRWHDIPLDQLHEVNRGEVQRLLARIDAAGADMLKPRDRVFLDRMAEMTGVWRTPASQPSEAT